ncbi:MAG: ATP synthase F1 subunit delta [bacterium]|nr:ATP synthase F1 subunit delta [bacterium]
MASNTAPEVVRRYAVTLLDAAAETDVADAVAGDLAGLRTTLAGSQDLQEFLRNRLVDGATVASALVAIFDGKVNRLTLNFLQMVAQRRRAHLLDFIIDTALKVLDERAGIATAEVRSAVELSAEQIKRLQERLSAHTGSRVHVEVHVDAGLRGGIIARIGDTVFDGSVETQLARLHRRLAGAIPAS